MANVLIVDDDLDSCDSLSRFLTKSGHQARCVSNGPAALAALASEVPDFIVLDVRMPGMDGITLLQVIRSYLRWSTVPVAIMTAYAEDSRLQRVGDLGVCCVFSKSKFTLGELLDCVNRALAGSDRADAGPSAGRHA